jgi:hypothetical protein
MSNDGLYLGAALLGLGGVYLLSQSGDGITGGGLGETIREQIESVVAVPQVFKETTEKLVNDATDFDFPDFNFPDIDFSGMFPTNEDINTSAGNAGSYAGESIGGALGSAFLNGVTGLYKGAMVAGAQFVGRNDVNSDNVVSEFMNSAGSLKNQGLSTLYYGVPAVGAGLLKGVLLGGNAGDAARYLSSSKNTSTNNVSNVSGLITGVVKANSSSNSSSSGRDGSALLHAFINAPKSTMSSKAIENTAGINQITRTIKKAAGVP